MIKGSYFGKLLKPLLFTLLISCFGLLGNFSNAGLIPNQLTKVSSEVDSNYLIAFLSKGGIITEYLGTSKGLIALSNNVLFWWGTNGLPYTFSPLGQGFFDRFYSCAEFTGDITTPTNCTEQILNSSSTEILRNFFSKVSIGDYSYYRYSAPYQGGVNCSSSNGGIEFCWSSHEIGNSLCLKNVYCSNGCQNGINACKNFCNGWGGCGGSFVNSQDLPSSTSFGTVSNKWIGPAPGQYGYGDNYDNSEGSDDVNLNNSLTGDYVYTNCTNGEVIQELENAGFNKYMCYGGLDNFDLYDSSIIYSPIPGTGKRLSQILSYSNAWDTPQEWFYFWDGLYQDRYNNSYNAMWESYPAVYRTWFDIYYQYGRNLNKNFDWVREYCTMTVDLDIDKTAIYKGQFFKGVCETVIDKKINSSYYVGSGNSAVGTNWNGIGNMGSGSDVVVSSDPSKFIQDYFNIIKSNIPSRYDLAGGVLPLYIITFMMAIILFRFISH